MSEEQFGIDNDGWDNDDLMEVRTLCSEFHALDYELSNCRRGAYADFGDTVVDLIVHLVRLKDRVEGAIVGLEENLD